MGATGQPDVPSPATAMVSRRVDPGREREPANVVLVHGAFVDGSGWRPVYDLLTMDATTSPRRRTPPCHCRATPPRRG
jgi:hypothetical protein